MFEETKKKIIQELNKKAGYELAYALQTFITIGYTKEQVIKIIDFALKEAIENDEKMNKVIEEQMYRKYIEKGYSQERAEYIARSKAGEVTGRKG